MSRLNHFLSGIRVLDLTRHLPGPLATLLLADMGAEVVKIEPPSGDELRYLSPKDDLGRPIYFEAINAGKTTTRMDLKDPSKRDVFLELLKTTDVLVDSFRPGVMERLDLSYSKLREVNPRLVYCSINGYGKNSPLARLAGHDANYLAAAGALAGTGTSETPVFFNPPIADCASSLMALTAILGALYSRVTTGEGCEIDLAIADSVMPLQIFQLATLGTMGVLPKRAGDPWNGGAAYYHIYETQDHRHVILGAVEPKFWEAFCIAANRRDWIARQDDPVPQSVLIRELSEFFSSRSLHQCLEIFESADCCFNVVLDLQEAVNSPHHLARGVVRRNAVGAYEALFPARVDGLPPSSRVPLGESVQVIASDASATYTPARA